MKALVTLGLVAGMLRLTGMAGQPAQVDETFSQQPVVLLAMLEAEVAPDLWFDEADLPEVLPVRSRRTTEGERWMDFYDEYGIQERHSMWVLSMIQSAKFGLDTLSFGAKETVKKLEFSYEFGRNGGGSGPRSVTPRAAYSLPLFGKFGNAKFRTVLLDRDQQTSRALLGFRLQIPFGDGAPEYR